MLSKRLARLLKSSLARGGGAFGIACACAPLAKAALWEDSLWTVSGQASATGAYDTNILALNNGPSDWYAIYQPSLTLVRTHSLLDFEAEAWADWTTFLEHTGYDSFDPGVRLTLSYPANVGSLATQTGEFHWVRSTAVNVDVGQRLTQDDVYLKYEGDLVNTGKTSIEGRASFERDSFLGSGYDTIDIGSFGTTWGYSPDGLFRAGVGYDLTLARSEPNSTGLGSQNEVEHAFTFQAQGEFTPTLTGKLSAGVAYADYTGTFSLSVWEAVALADLTWKPTQRLAIELQASRAPSFNAVGYVDLASKVGLEIRESVAEAFTVRAGVNGGYTNHQLTVTYRTDKTVGASGGLDYNLTGKLTASLGYSWTRQDSDVEMFTYSSQIVSGNVSYKF